MRVMIDTNIFISAILFPDGRASAALKKALVPPCKPLTCSYVIDELKRKLLEKFPDRTEDLESFLQSALSVIEIVDTPTKVAKTPEHSGGIASGRGRRHTRKEFGGTA